MKISVFELKVIRTIINDKEHYLICKECLTPNTYKEVITGRKVVVNSPEDAEELSKYYAPLAVCNYSTGKPLRLGRRELLTKCIEINIYKAIKKHEDELKARQERDKKIAEVDSRVKLLSTQERIEEAAKHLFPKNGSWSASEFRKSDSSLIHHLRDEKWLATRLQSMALENVPFLEILDYVTTSPEFTKMRYAYELSIVKWQIEWMRSGGEGWLVPEGYGEDFVMMDENYDIAFRKGIVSTLTAINLNSNVIEDGIERNTDLWLLDLMKRAYHNTYRYPAFSCIDPSDIPEDPEHEEKWLRLRLYEYYQEHKDSVDKYGHPTEEMLITPEEAEELKLYLVIKHEEKMADIERAKEKSKEKGFGIKLKPVDYFCDSL